MPFPCGLRPARGVLLALAVAAAATTTATTARDTAGTDRRRRRALDRRLRIEVSLDRRDRRDELRSSSARSPAGRVARSVARPDVSTYNDAGLTAGATYSYRVAAVNANENGTVQQRGEQPR